MTAIEMKPRVTSLAPQFLVDDLARSITYYEKLGFTFGEPWEGFYAIGRLDGLELHLKEAPKNDDERRHRRANEHLDAAAGVEGIEAFYAQCTANEQRSSNRLWRLRGAQRTSTSRTLMAISSRPQTEWRAGCDAQRGRRITTRWTGAAVACFASNLVRRRLREIAPPAHL